MRKKRKSNISIASRQKAWYTDKNKYIDSSKQIYRAVHLYFRADNQSFPWELQIWNRCDAETNFESHKEYKQAYTIWEQNRKEGSL